MIPNYKKYIIWSIIGAILLFSGWAVKDGAIEVQKGAESLGRLLMSFGFVIFALLIYYTMKDNLDR